MASQHNFIFKEYIYFVDTYIDLHFIYFSYIIRELYIKTLVRICLQSHRSFAEELHFHKLSLVVVC